MDLIKEMNEMKIKKEEEMAISVSSDPIMDMYKKGLAGVGGYAKMPAFSTGTFSTSPARLFDNGAVYRELKRKHPLLEDITVRHQLELKQYYMRVTYDDQMYELIVPMEKIEDAISPEAAMTNLIDTFIDTQILKFKRNVVPKRKGISTKQKQLKKDWLLV